MERGKERQLNHYHSSVDDLIIYGVSAVIFINVLRIVGSMMISRGGKLESVGKSMVALT